MQTERIKEILDAIKANDKIAIFRHFRPDGDAVGSMTALAEIFRLLGRSPKILLREDTPSRLAFLTEGIERAESPLGQTLVAVDTASPSQLGELYEQQIPSLSIDHHRVNTPYSDNYTEADASSAGEVLYTLARELESMGKLSISRRLAERLYAAISSDTGGFLYSNATERTYLAAAHLISLGIDHAEINRKLFNSKTLNTVRAEGYTAMRLKRAAEGRITYFTLPKKEREELGLPFEAFETAIDMTRVLEGTEIAFVLKESDDGKYKGSIRSVGQNVAEVAGRHNGGGHVRAAGCTVTADSLEAAEKILLADLIEIL